MQANLPLQCWPFSIEVLNADFNALIEMTEGNDGNSLETIKKSGRECADTQIYVGRAQGI